MWLHGLSVYVNEERSRTFLGLRVCQGRTELDDLVAEADKCWAEYRLPPFYKVSQGEAGRLRKAEGGIEEG